MSAGTLIEAGNTYSTTKTIWNNNGWTQGFCAAPRTRWTIGSTTFSYRFRVDQRNLSNSSWNTIRDYNGSNSRDWTQYRRERGDRRPRWRGRRTTGFGQGNPNVRLRTYGGAWGGSQGNEIVWCANSNSPPTSDVNDQWQNNSGLLITWARRFNMTDRS